MDENLKQQLEGRISVLPQELRERLVSPWRNTVDLISDKQNLSQGQKESLGKEVFMILAGLEPISKFRQNLMNELGVSYDQALKISYELNSLFGPVMEILKTIEEQIKVLDDEEDKIIYPTVDSVEEDIAEKETVFSSELDTPQTTEPVLPGTTPDTNPEHLVPDHAGMETLDGPHTHSQTAMPTEQSERKVVAEPETTSESKPEQKTGFGNRFGSFIPQSKKSFGSIVDQKLNGIVISNTQDSVPTEKLAQKNGYSGQDPYREPLE